MNLFWNVKIQKIRVGFKAIYFIPLIFLHNLIPAPKGVFKIPPITIGDVVSIIKKSSNSSSRGFNETSMKFLKISPTAFASHITFAINRSLMAGIFPSILKISRILPILKQGKNRLDKTSYRPISNLHCVEKIFEEYIKRHLLIYLNEHKIIIKNHHGGIKGHSTQTARAVIENCIEYNYQQNRVVAAVSTDLSAAFNTVDHIILLAKLKYYGFSSSN